MAVVQYTKKVLIERIIRHINNDFPGTDFTISNNEVLLYIDQALAAGVVGQMYGAAKLEGNLATPEAYISRFLITDLQQDSSTGYWYGTLPQPPVSLPLGYSVTECYFAKTAYGKSQMIFLIKSNRVSYREFMPMPTGTRAWFEGDQIWLQASNNHPLLNESLYVKMLQTRTQDVNEMMHMAPDLEDMVFKGVIAMCKDRLSLPKDIIQDNQPAGNKSS